MRQGADTLKVLEKDSLMKEIIALHREEYGKAPQVAASAPGVVNILGEHTEETGGFVLAMAINRAVQVAVSPRQDNSIKFFSSNLSERKRTNPANLKFKREDRWANYLKGVLFGFDQEGISVGGMDVTIRSEVPAGIGLGSSSALCLAMGAAFKALRGARLSTERMFNICRYAEESFMEQRISLVGLITGLHARAGNALLVDAKLHKQRQLPFNLGEARLLVTDSRVQQQPGENEYLQRLDDCRKCEEILNRRKSGSSFRDHSPKDIRESIGLFPEGIRRRCLHVVEENHRVKEAEACLRQGNLAGLGRLLSRSHESLRDLFEVSCPELDWLVKRSGETEGILGSRLTGSGFGGCTITLLKSGALDEYRKRLEEYERIFGFRAEMFVCEASDGVKIR